jgi:hypothetical protein
LPSIVQVILVGCGQPDVTAHSPEVTRHSSRDVRGKHAAGTPGPALESVLPHASAETFAAERGRNCR